uniref:Biotin carboxylation domain-containing protein n=1 Tax=Ananas comosus var. bracteatus TaxID=296719 RepID=A0A6V7PWA8_ANACO|nr:unnamed protein product [Ananas comosus var. bracteatus]
MDTLSGQFYFMEMKTRLQNEARIYAENAPRGFLPATGTLHYYRPVPVTPTVRVETGAEEGDTVSMHYDPMIAKLVASLTMATVDCRSADQYWFPPRACRSLAFERGLVETHFIEHHKSDLLVDSAEKLTEEASNAAKLGATLVAACICEKEYITSRESLPCGDNLLPLRYTHLPFRMHHRAKRVLELEWDKELDGLCNELSQLAIMYQSDGSYFITHVVKWPCAGFVDGLKAEQQMEENMLLGNGIVFSRLFEAFPYDGSGDKIKLLPSCFKELSDQGALDKGPLYFRLSKVNEGELPPYVWTNLFPDTNVEVPLIEVRYASLPKGTYAKLKPKAVGFSDLPNHKAILETTLRKHATLSEGDVITVYYGELQYRLRVLELKPSSSVSILETDIEVDIEGSDSVLDNENEQHVLIPLVAESGIVEEGKFKYYKFSIEETLSEKVSTGLMNIEVKIEADTSDGDTNIYVSRHPLKDQSLVAGTYSIGVFGFKGVAKFNISVEVKDINNNRQKVGEHLNAYSQVNSDSVECRNCRHYISSRTIVIHEAYCIRHNLVCQHEGCGVVLRKEQAANHVHCSKCGQAFQQREMEKHMKVFHEPLHCPCGVVLEKEEVVQHQSSTCPLRLIVCHFCGDMVQAGTEPLDARDRLRGLSEHESICGFAKSAQTYLHDVESLNPFEDKLAVSFETDSKIRDVANPRAAVIAVVAFSSSSSSSSS